MNGSEHTPPLSPKAEREWKPTGGIDINIPKDAPRDDAYGLGMDPSKEGLSNPDRKGSTVQDRRRSLSATLAVHIAAGATALTVHDKCHIIELDPTELTGERQIEALGNTVGERILHMVETDAHNREVRRRFEQTRHDYYDDLLDTYLNPESREYKERRGIPPVEVFAHVDALLHVEAMIAKTQLESLDEDRVQALVREYEDALISRHRENMEIIFQHRYEWTGNVRQDFPMLQKALFQGEDRYFYNPGFEETLYRTGQEQFSEQLQTGLVNCQVARITPMALFEIYQHHELPTDDLENVRVVTWSDHVFSGYEHPETHETFTLMEGSFGTPEWPGLHPPSAQDAGVALSAASHLAIYLQEHKPTSEERQRLATLIPNDLGMFSSEPLPTEAVEFGHYEEIVAGGRPASETIRVRELEEQQAETITEQTEGYAKSVVSKLLERYLQESADHYSPFGSTVILPPWIHSDAVRTLITENGAWELARDKTREAVYRTLLLDGQFSQVFVDRAMERGVAEWQENQKWDKEHPDNLSMARFILGQCKINPLAARIAFQLRNEDWFLPTLELLITENIEIVKQALAEEGSLQAGNGAPVFYTIVTSDAVMVIGLLDDLAQEYKSEYGEEAINPFSQKAERMRRALAPLQEHVGVSGLTLDQIQTLPQEEFRRHMTDDVQDATNVSGIVLGARAAKHEWAVLERLEQDPEQYAQLLLQGLDTGNMTELSEFAIHANVIERVVKKRPDLLTSFQTYATEALRRIHDDALQDELAGGYVYLGSQNILRKQLELHRSASWLRPVMESEWRRVHARRPFSDFDIHYARLDRFGIDTVLPKSQLFFVDSGIPFETTRDGARAFQVHTERNEDVDALVREVYLASDKQKDRLGLLLLFHEHTHLVPPVTKEQLLPEDLAFIEAVPDSESFGIVRGLGEASLRRYACNLKPFYAPQTIDITHELRQNPENPDLEKYDRWGGMNPDLGLQYAEQWVAYRALAPVTP